MRCNGTCSQHELDPIGWMWKTINSDDNSRIILDHEFRSDGDLELDFLLDCLRRRRLEKMKISEDYQWTILSNVCFLVGTLNQESAFNLDSAINFLIDIGFGRLFRKFISRYSSKPHDGHFKDFFNKYLQSFDDSFDLESFRLVYLILLNTYIGLVQEGDAPVACSSNNSETNSNSDSPTQILKQWSLTVMRKYLPQLIMIYVIFKVESEVKNCANIVEEDEQCLAKISTELETNFEKLHFCSTERPSVLRSLLYLSSLNPAPVIMKWINRMMKKHLTADSESLEIFLDSTIESDRSSEHETTIHNRIQSLSTIVTELSVGLKSRSAYYQNIVRQCFPNLIGKLSPTPIHQPEIYWRSAVTILDGINTKEPKLVESIVFDKLYNVLDGGSSLFSLETAIQIIHRFLLGRVCQHHLSRLFSPLYYLTLTVETTASLASVKSLLFETLLESMDQIPNSIYLLDDCVHHKQSKWYGRFRCKIESNESTIEYRVAHNNRQEQLTDETEFEKTEKLVLFTLEFLKKLPINLRFDYFFVQLDRLIGSGQSPITFLLIGPFAEELFGETVSKSEENSREELLLGSDRIVRFLNSTFERIVNRLISGAPADLSNSVDDFEDDNFKESYEIWKQTLSLCLKIMAILVDKLQNPSNKLSSGQDSLANKLKPCYTSLRILLQNPKTATFIDPFDRMIAEEIYSQMEILLLASKEYSGKEEFSSCNQSSSLVKILDELDHPLMPVRAHALITIKQLIYSGDKAIDSPLNRSLIMDRLKLALLDTESYIYLAAINALGALAIVHTKEVLPLLIEELVGQQEEANSAIADSRLADRLKIGQVIVQLAHSIGDLAYHYSPLFISGLLRGVEQHNCPEIKISCLSCLGEFCKAFSRGLSQNIVELVTMSETLLSNDPCLEVRRASAMMLSLLLRGLTPETALLIQDQLKPIKDCILKASATCLDETLQRHCSLAYEELSRIAKELMQSATTMNDKYLTVLS